MTLVGVRNRIAGGEDETTEFARTTRNVAWLARVVCSFLNGRGGAIYCGVSDKGAPVGLGEDADNLAIDLERALKVRVSPASLFTAESILIDGHRLVIVEVPGGKDRPYVADGGVWLRRGGSTIAATALELRELVRDAAEGPTRWERRVSTGMSIDELDGDEVRATVRDIEKLGLLKLTDRDDDLAVLKDLAVYDALSFTHAGDLMFSTRPSQRHPQCRAQLIRYAGDRTSDLYDNQRAFEGPLMRVYQDLTRAIAASLPVGAVFVRGQSRRVDMPAYHEFAIFEGVLNAIVHRDYSAYAGGLQVRIFDSRIEIWNSGRLPNGLSPGDLRRDHPSILVNPDMANIFYLRGEMERLGRGTERIVKASQELGARPPLWRDSETGVTLTLFAARPNLTGKPIELNDRQLQLLLDLQPGDEVTPKAYHQRYAAEVTPRQARRDLEELEGIGWLEREGQTRATRYRVI